MYFLYSIFILSLATQILLIILLLLLFCFHVNINISKKKLIKMKETEFLKKKENERGKKTPTLNHETQKKKLKKNRSPLYPFPNSKFRTGSFLLYKKNTLSYFRNTYLSPIPSSRSGSTKRKYNKCSFI